jgi:hypothetical protein
VPVTFWVLVFAIGLAATIDALADGYGYPGELVRWLAVMALVGVAILQVHRHVLRRPRPLADPDVLAADDAIRTRTLRVLSGSTMAIGGYLAAAVLAAVPQYWLWLNDRAVSAIGVLLAPILGVIIATAPVKPRSRADEPMEQALRG